MPKRNLAHERLVKRLNELRAERDSFVSGAPCGRETPWPQQWAAENPDDAAQLAMLEKMNPVMLGEYFLSCVDLSDYDRTEYPTLKSIIEAEVGVNGPVNQKAVENWLRGLPSACTIEFSSYEIAELIRRSDKPNYCENLYWSHAAFTIYRHAVREGN